MSKTIATQLYKAPRDEAKISLIIFVERCNILPAVARQIRSHVRLVRKYRSIYKVIRIPRRFVVTILCHIEKTNDVESGKAYKKSIFHILTQSIFTR